MFKIIMLSFIVTIVFFTEAISSVTDYFVAQDEIKENGYQCGYLKNTQKMNCVSSSFDDHYLNLFIYDKTGDDKYIYKDKIMVTSWYNKAKSKLVYLFGINKQPFILVTFEGNVGTNSSQTILMMIGWNGFKFVPVLMETIDYDMDGINYSKELNAEYVLLNVGSVKPLIRMTYCYKKTVNGKRITKKWNDLLVWNVNKFSFYDKNTENQKYENSKSLKKKISAIRLKILGTDIDLHKLDINTLKIINITDIFE